MFKSFITATALSTSLLSGCAGMLQSFPSDNIIHKDFSKLGNAKTSCKTEYNTRTAVLAVERSCDEKQVAIAKRQTYKDAADYDYAKYQGLTTVLRK